MRHLFIALFLISLSLNSTAQNETDSLVWDFGRQLENSFQKNDLTFFTEQFTNDVFMKNIFEGYIEPRDLSTYLDKNKFKPNEFILGYSNALKRIFEEGGALNLVTYYTDAYNNYYLIFRMNDRGTINYHEFYLDIDKDKILISDVYMYTSGQRYSASLQRVLYSSILKFDGATINPEDSLLNAAYVVVEKALKYKKTNQLAKGKKFFLDNIDFDLIKNDKILVLNYIGFINPDLDPDGYLEALTILMEQHPNNVTSWLMGIDFYFLNENYTECLAVIDSLQTSTGDDYLNLYRGNVYSMMEDNENAMKYLKQFIIDFPYLYDAYETYIYLACEEKNEKELMLMATNLKEIFEFNYHSISDIFEESCPDFYSSKTFQDWLPKDNEVYNLKGDFFSVNDNSFDMKMKTVLNEPGSLIIPSNPAGNMIVNKYDMFFEMNQIATDNTIEQTFGADNEISFSFVVDDKAMEQQEAFPLNGKKIELQKNKKQLWQIKEKKQYNEDELKEIEDIIESANDSEKLKQEAFSLFPDAVKIGDTWDITEANLLKYFQSTQIGKNEPVGQMMLNEVVEREDDKVALVSFNFKLIEKMFDEFKISADCQCAIERSLIDFIEKDISCDCDIELGVEEAGTAMLIKIKSAVYALLETPKKEK